MLVSGHTLRLASLVAAATATGYLWRAALEPRNTKEVFRIAPPALRFQVPESAFHPLQLLRPAARKARLRVVVKARIRERARPRRTGGTRLIARIVTPASSHTARPARTRARVSPKPTTRHHAARPARKLPSKPRPKPPPPPPPPPAPVQPPPPPPVWQPAPTPEPPVETRPGWGKGDKNHVHTGPPGQQKEKKEKKNKK